MGVREFIANKKQQFAKQREDRVMRQKEQLRVDLSKAKQQRMSMEETAKMKADLAREKQIIKEQQYKNSVFGKLSSLGNKEVEGAKGGGIFSGQRLFGEEQLSSDKKKKGKEKLSAGGFAEYRGFGR
jgi:hypothetical protein